MAQDKQQELLYKIGMGMRPATWFNFRVDFFGSILYSLYNVVVGQFFVPMAIRHGATNVEVGLLTAAPAIGSLLSPVWAGMIGSRSPKPFVLWPNVIGRLSVCIVAAWLSPWVFVVVSFFINFLAGIQAPAYPALLTRIYPGRLRGRLMGYVRVAQGFFLIPLAYVAGRWIDASGDSLPLICGAIFGTLSVIVFSFVREVEPVPEIHDSLTHDVSGLKARALSQWRMVKENPPLAMFLLATTAAGFGNLLGGPLYQIYQIHTLNLNNGQIGVTRMIYYGFLLVAYFVMGWIIDKLSPKHAMILGIGAYVLAPLLYVLFGSYAAVIAASGCLGIGDATWDIGVMAYVFKLAPGREAAVFGMHLLLFGIRGSIAPVLSTLVTQSLPLQSVLLAATGFCLLGMLMMVVSGKSIPAENDPLPVEQIR